MANLLTLLRIALIPVLVVIFFSTWDYNRQIACLIFVVASLTDWLDGYLARRLQQQSRFGEFLDPVADKLIVAAALILLVQAHPTPIMAVCAGVIIGREITISALREWMAEVGSREKVAVSVLGKLKTIAQMVALTTLLYQENLWGIPMFNLGLYLLYCAVVLTLMSMLLYLKAAWASLKY